ncbi:hypothetical protein SLE2022_325970 [Rubroshorea leprosula]
MKVISWNSRGVLYRPFKREVKELLCSHKPNVICFMETKVDFGSRALHFMRRYGYTFQFQVPASGLSQESFKEEFWHLHDWKASHAGAWVLMGDLNDVASMEECYLSSSRLQSLEKSLLEDYQQVLYEEELLWFQKTRVDWIASGDRNTSFYHMATMVRQNKNDIGALKIDGEWCMEVDGLKSHVQGYFEGLFARRETFSLLENLSDFQPSIFIEDHLSLTQPTTLEEVRKALFSMKGLKSLGPNGIPALFYQWHWHTIAATFLEFVNQALLTGSFDPSLTKAIVVLILKEDLPDTVQKFRPISLSNVAYKFLSLAGRSTVDNIILTQEAVHSMRHLKAGRGAMVLKIDLHKAFDSIDWDFLRQVLLDFNIPLQLVELIMFLVTSVQLSVLWNVTEKLTQMIQKRVDEKVWKPFKLSRGGVALSHLFYADNLMLFAQASRAQLDVIMDVLNQFSSSSGIPIIHGLHSSKHYEYILEKMQKKLASWKGANMSLAGRKVLVQSVTASILTYTMQSILLPNATCDAIDHLNRDFLWGSNSGVRKPHPLGWRILKGENALWCRVMQAKYLRGRNFMEVGNMVGASFIWRGIVKCRSILQQGVHWRIGSGEKLHCAERIRLFVWLLVRGRVLTNSVRVACHMAPLPLCPRCDSSNETPIHLLRDCFYAKTVWSLLGFAMSEFLTLDSFPWLKKFSTISRAFTFRQAEVSRAILFLSAIWLIWKDRNALVFQNHRSRPQKLCAMIWQYAKYTEIAMSSSSPVKSRLPRWVRWMQPMEGWYKLNSDGSFNVASNSAKLWGLREGLKLCKSLGIARVVAEMDSLVVVRFIIDKRELDNLSVAILMDIRSLMSEFEECILQHVLREGNATADFLASLGHSSPPGRSLLDSPPTSLWPILTGDQLGVSFLRF